MVNTNMSYEKSKVFLATISSVYDDWAPYAAACLISHCMKNEYIKNNYEFLEPEYRHKWDDIEFNMNLLKTDILGLTCYVWNQVANDKIAKRFKSYNPDGIVIYGGPNVPEENLEDYKREFVDHYVTGPGELKFEKILDANSDSVYTLPTPYIDGILDNILSKDIAVAFETTRGCPYHCAFCDWGGVARSKIKKVEDDDVYKTLNHILKFKVKRLEFLDANYGIFARDVDFVKYIAENKQRDDMALTFAGFTKNGSKWMTDIMNIIMNNFNDRMRSVKISLQTLTPEVLEVIDRNNIKPEKLLSILDDLKDIDVSSELILGLPGETANSWADTLFKHQDLGIDFARSYPLYVLPNTPMSKKEYREKYKIKTKKIILPDGETFEMIYECYSYDLEEITKIYLTWLYFNTFYNFGLDKTISKESLKDFLINPPAVMQLHEVKESLYRIFKPEESFCLEGYDLKYLHHHLGRGRELIYMKNAGYKIRNPDKELQSPFAVIK